MCRLPYFPVLPRSAANSFVLIVMSCVAGLMRYASASGMLDYTRTKLSGYWDRLGPRLFGLLIRRSVPPEENPQRSERRIS